MKARRLQRQPGLLEAAPAAKGAGLAGSGNALVAEEKSRAEVRRHGAGPTTGSGVRPEKVERARRMIAEAEYPSREVLEKVAQTLLRKVKSWGFVGKGRTN